MNQRFTQEMLIKYLYNETDVSERQAIKQALRSDPQLMEQYNQLCVVQDWLSTEKRSPSDTSVNIVLDYSNKSSKLEAV